MMSAFRGTGRSSLSNEVAVVAAGFVCAMVSSLLDAASPLFGPVWVLTLLACLATLLALGWVYRIPGRPGWRGLVVLQPLSMGVIVGWIGWSGLVPGSRSSPLLLLLGVFVLLDLAITLFRIAVLHLARGRATPVHPRLFRVRNLLLLARALLVDVVPLQLVVFGRTRAAILCLSIGVLLDRFSFYGLAVKESTESEARRVESLLAEDTL
jgi:hypothetical protein